jgi:hypothetical protein
MLVKINVTQEMIDQGCRGGIRTCPVARAIKAVVYTYLYVTVSGYEFFIGKSPDADNYEGTIPDDIADKIFGFDNYSVMEPFSFDLEIPDWCLNSSVGKCYS